MKKIIIKNLFAVGMRHHGSRSISVGTGMKCVREPRNPFDRNAVALCTLDGTRRAYLCREHATIISFLIDTYEFVIVAKIKSLPQLCSWRSGLQQTVNIGFYVSEENVAPVTEYLQASTRRISFIVL